MSPPSGILGEQLGEQVFALTAEARPLTDFTRTEIEAELRRRKKAAHERAVAALDELDSVDRVFAALRDSRHRGILDRARGSSDGR